MKKIKKYFHLLMLISAILLDIMLLTICIAGFNLNKKFDILWICSKLETIRQIMNNAVAYQDKGNNNTPPPQIIPTDIPSTEIPSNEINDTSDIVDTTDIDTINNTRLLDGIEYNSYYINPNSYKIEYLNSKEECGLFISKTILVLDEKIKNDFFDSSDDALKEIDEFINSKISDEDNIDKSDSTFYNGDTCTKTFIIFNTSDDKEKFISNIDNFKNIYKFIFPNMASTIIAIISFLSLFVLFFISLINFFSGEKDYSDKYKKNPELKYKLIITGIYLPIFIGYFIYMIYASVKINKINYSSLLQNISADKNILKCLKAINDNYIKKRNVIICSLIYLSVSIIIFIIGWSLNQLYFLFLRLKGQKMKLQWINLKKKFNI
jgi:hypothetical protein